MTNKDKDHDVIIDKAAFTLHLSEKQQESLFNKLVYDKIYKDYNGKVYYSDSSYRYHNNYQFAVDCKNSAEVSIYPYDPEHNYFRVEYNPTKLGKTGRKELRDLLINLHSIGVVKKIYYRAPITRLDLTVDIYNMEPNLYIHYNRAIHSEIVIKNGNIQSQVVGSDRSDCRITLYDKNAELKSRGIDEKDGNYQRLEIRLRNLRCSMHNLNTNVSLLNNINGISFFRSDFLQDRSFSKVFRNVASRHGLNKALWLQERNDRLCYRRYLEEYRAYPVRITEDDYFRACHKAFNSLNHAGYREQFLAKAA